MGPLSDSERTSNDRRLVGAPDPIRAGETSDTGDLGEAAAVKAFAQLKWPATRTTAAQDLGTDLLVAARDRRFHRGEYLGAQVKSGDTNLGTPVIEDGFVGWWVKVKATHANYWLDNALPHILILYDHNTDLCHWAHLNEETIETTGVGRKVKMPASQVVAPEQIDSLLAVAATARAAVPLEGTAWDGGTPKALTDHLRFALIAPRLMAPHPNSGLDPTTPAEAVALLMQARGRQVWPPGSSREGVPSRLEAATHDLWSWRFVAALADWLTTTKSPDFETLRDQAPTAHERAAVTAVIAHRCMSNGEATAARDLLQAEIEADAVAPVDHAWLHLHLAQAHQELADLEEARNAATLSLATGATQRHDVTATAIRGVAAAILFDTSSAGEYDIASTIRYNDTAVAWWRSQTAARGTAALVETSFDRSVGREPSDTNGIRANNELFAASVQAGVLGSHGQWRHLSGLLARQEFIDPQATDADAWARTLEALRRTGDEHALDRAAGWLIANGPADAVAKASFHVDLNSSTSSSIAADLALLRIAGDILDESIAIAGADWLEAALEDPSRLRALTHRSAYDPQQWIAERLAGIFPAIPKEGAERAVCAIERYGAGFQVLAARDWGRVLLAIPRWAWTQQQATRLAALAPSFDEPELVAAIGCVSQAFDPAARGEIVDLVRGGCIWALGYIDDLAALTPGVIDEIRRICALQVAKDRDAERGNTLVRGASRPRDALIALTLTQPDDSVWGEIEAAIADPKMPAWYKQGAILRIAASRDKIKGDCRASLARAVREAGQAPPVDRWRWGDVELTAEAAYASLLLDNATQGVAEEMMRLAGGGTLDRQWAAKLAYECGEISALSVLTTDQSPFVRAEASRGLARLAADGVKSPLIGLTLRRAVEDRGCATGLAVAGVSSEAPAVGALAEARQILQTHPSAAVRRLVRASEDQS